MERQSLSSKKLARCSQGLGKEISEFDDETMSTGFAYQVKQQCSNSCMIPESQAPGQTCEPDDNYSVISTFTQFTAKRLRAINEIFNKKRISDQKESRDRLNNQLRVKIETLRLVKRAPIHEIHISPEFQLYTLSRLIRQTDYQTTTQSLFMNTISSVQVASPNGVNVIETLNLNQTATTMLSTIRLQGDKNRLMAGAFGGQVLIFDLERGKLAKTFGPPRFSCSVTALQQTRVPENWPPSILVGFENGSMTLIDERIRTPVHAFIKSETMDKEETAVFSLMEKNDIILKTSGRSVEFFDLRLAPLPFFSYTFRDSFCRRALFGKTNSSAIVLLANENGTTTLQEINTISNRTCEQWGQALGGNIIDLLKCDASKEFVLLRRKQNSEGSSFDLGFCKLTEESCIGEKYSLKEMDSIQLQSSAGEFFNLDFDCSQRNLIVQSQECHFVYEYLDPDQIAKVKQRLEVLTKI